MSLSEPKVWIGRDEIASTVERLAGRICRDYSGGNLVLVGILKGAFVFLSDLMRRLDIPVEVDFVRLASYGSEQVSSRNVRITKDLEIPLQGKDVLIVEDIVDTGWTLAFLMEKLSERHPKSLRICALLDKEARREVDIPVDYVGFPIEDRFVVGYGLDVEEKYRNLPDICFVEEVSAP
jgi:hypoxanthine phosphoribosyltransferase